MEEINLAQLFNYFKSKAIYILFAVALAFCLSSIYINRFRVPKFTSSTTILLNQANSTVAINTNDINLNKSLVTTYSEIIKSKRVLNQVIELMNLDIEYVDLYSKISVSEVTDTSIIRISVTDKNNELAADIANSIANIFTKEIVEIYKLENISIIDEAEVSEIASSASALKVVGISSIAGAFIAIAVVFVLFYFDTTIKNEEDIEAVTGLPVIGIIPLSREKIKQSQHRLYYRETAKRHIAPEREIEPIKPDFEVIKNVNPVVQKEEVKEDTSEIKRIELDETTEEEMNPSEENRVDDETKFEKTEILDIVEDVKKVENEDTQEQEEPQVEEKMEEVQIEEKKEETTSEEIEESEEHQETEQIEENEDESKEELEQEENDKESRIDEFRREMEKLEKRFAENESDYEDHLGIDSKENNRYYFNE